MKDIAVLIGILTIFMALLFGSMAHAFDSDSDDELICAKTQLHGNQSQAISCISKASIERDKAELKLIKLQIKKLESDMKKDETVKSK